MKARTFRALRWHYYLYRLVGMRIGFRGFRRFMVDTMPIFLLCYPFYCVLPVLCSKGKEVD